MAVQSALKTKSFARRQVLGVCFFLVAITWLVFGQTVRYDFVNYDDNDLRLCKSGDHERIESARDNLCF